MYGHSAIMDSTRMYIFGGYSSQVLSRKEDEGGGGGEYSEDDDKGDEGDFSGEDKRGGRGEKPSALYYLDFRDKLQPSMPGSQGGNLVWHRIELSQKDSSPPPSSLGGHSCLKFESAMYVFGGNSRGQNSNSLYKFDFIEKKWSLLAPANNLLSSKSDESCAKGNEKIIQNSLLQDPDIPIPVQEHSAAIYDRKMFVFGGMSPIGNLTKDLYSFDFG